MTQYNRKKIHRYVYLFGLALLITCIPLSVYLVSIAQFVLTLNWIAEGEFRKKLRRLADNYSIMVFASVFLLYALGYFYSEDKTMGLERVKNALPLLALPVIMGTSVHPGEKNIKRLLLLFSAGVTAAAITCVVHYLVRGLPPGGDYRQISIILPHIRFAILIVMAIMILAYFAILNENIDAIADENLFSGNRIIRFIFLGTAVFLVGFLFFLRSATGIMIFAVVTVVFLGNLSLRMINKASRLVAIFLTAIIIISALSFTFYTWHHNFHSEKIHASELEKYTINGNPYFHDTISGILENGNYTEIYWCGPELEREWNRISSISYQESDLRGQPIRSTLKRYLTSKGLRKDSVSVHLLTAEDIHKIEQGLANYKFSENAGLYQRLYETMYEIHVFQRSGFVERHSFGQRLAFTVESVRLIRQNLWIGTGSGDVFESLRVQALEDKITIDAKWEGKPHNQFAFILLAFGFTGLAWISFCWIFPVIRNGANNNLLFNLFALIILISMLVMDTLESYDSMVFFAFFYSLLVFGRNTDPSDK